MKKIFLFALTFFMQYTYALEMYAPPYLLENQPLPCYLKIDAAYVLSGDITKNSFFVDLSAISLISDKDLTAVIGGGYISEMFRVQEGLPKHVQSCYANFFGNGSIEEEWYWITYQEVSLNGEDLQGCNSNSLQYFQYSGVGYKPTRLHSLQTGLIYCTGLDSPWILPKLSYVYNKSNFIGELDFPAGIQFKYLLNDKSLIKGGIDMTSREYLTTEDVLKSSETKISAGYEMSITGDLWLNFMLGWIIKKELSYRDDSFPSIEANSDYFVKGSLYFRAKEKAE